MTKLAQSIDSFAFAHLQGWVDKTEESVDEIRAAPVQAMSATLDRTDVSVETGAMLPPLWHWLFFLPTNAQAELGPDGHPRPGGFLPPVPLPRRMWAGSCITWETGNPLRVGDTVRRKSRIVSVQHKSGRSGDLIFVALRHDFHNAAGLALTENQDIVYRAAAQPGDTQVVPVVADADAPWQRVMTPDAPLLFRYSALTFNSHRIHYDRSYATGVEGYAGLVVHGPLIATLLLDLVRRYNPSIPIRSFDFKAVRPTFDGRPMCVTGCPTADGNSAKLWARDDEGWLTMLARLQFA